MNEAVFAEAVIAELGKRYQLGATKEAGWTEVLRRYAKETFRPTRLYLGGPSGRSIAVLVDFRLHDETSRANARALERVVEEATMRPRGFVQVSEEETPMRSADGQASGSVWTLRYEGSPGDPSRAAVEVRALCEGMERIVQPGQHGPPDVTAVDLPPPSTPPRPRGRYRFELRSGFLGGEFFVADLAEGTLQRFVRKLFSVRAEGEPVRLTHVTAVTVRTAGGRFETALAVKDRVDDPLVVARASSLERLEPLARRLAEGLRCEYRAP